MESPASLPVYIGAELDPTVGSVPQTPILSRSGSLPIDYIHPTVEVPSLACKETEDTGTDVVRQLSTRMPLDSIPLKKREVLGDTEGSDMPVPAVVTFAALPTALSSASMTSLGSRQGSEIILPDCSDTSLSRSHTLCSASTTSVHSSDEFLSSPEIGKLSTEASVPCKQSCISSNHSVVADEKEASDDDDEPSNIVDRMTPPLPLTPVNSFGMPAGSQPGDFDITEEPQSPEAEEQKDLAMDEIPEGSLQQEPEAEVSMESAVENKPTEDEEEAIDEPMEVTAADNDDGGDEDKMEEDSQAEAGPSGDDTAVLPAPPPFDPSMRPIDIVFSFDTTGSMSSCIEQIQQQLKEIINRLFMDVPNLNIGIVAHGDYCDAEHFYVSELFHLSNDLDAIAGFVSNVSGTGGGDFPECYELVLRRVKTEIKWRDWSQRALVMVGDAVPHEVDDNPQNINWRDEVKELFTQQVSIDKTYVLILITSNLRSLHGYFIVQCLIVRYIYMCAICIIGCSHLRRAVPIQHKQSCYSILEGAR